MSTYTPDCWTVLEVCDGNKTWRRVFAGWYGGYLNGDSWKMSSGIVETKEFDDRFEFLNESGSLYVCYKGSKRMSGYMMQIYSSFQKQIAEQPEDSNITMKEIEYDLSRR